MKFGATQPSWSPSYDGDVVTPRGQVTRAGAGRGSAMLDAVPGGPHRGRGVPGTAGSASHPTPALLVRMAAIAVTIPSANPMSIRRKDQECLRHELHPPAEL